MYECMCTCSNVMYTFALPMAYPPLEKLLKHGPRNRPNMFPTRPPNLPKTMFAIDYCWF